MQKTHPEQLRMELQQEVTDREIQDTLFFMDGDKAHGPDGYTVHFFKKAWHIVKGDVLADIRSFFFSSKLLGEVNATIITLVPKDEVFCFCRFSASNGKGGNIVIWDTKTWKRIGSKTVVCDTISASIVSPDGKLLACWTTQGDVFILNSASKQVQTVVRKAHVGFVTALSFSHDSRALASVSLDSSARVTLIEENKKTGAWSLWAILFVILLAIVVYLLFYEESS